MTKLLAVLLATQLPLIEAWAPIQTLPSQIPKTLEFAEKVYFLPKTQEISGPRSLPEEFRRRKMPWTHDSTQDTYFFDGYSGEVDEWPSCGAFLKSRTALQMTPKAKEERLEAVDFYYDDMGNAVSWKQPKTETRVQDELQYFDDMGNSVSWTKSLVDPVASLLNKNPKEVAVAAAYLGLERCETTYYDDTGSLMCWAGQ